jgi:ABC-type multidrug transport system ATPase subunit
VIVAKDLSKSFGALKVLKRVSLCVDRGEIVLLVGANGSGKSTLLKLLAGLARTEGGTLARAASRVGFVSHTLFLYSRLTVRENLELFSKAAGLSSEIDQVVVEMDLARVLDRPLAELSKGTQARVGIARALLGSPDLLIFDEPTSNLDERSTTLFAAALEGLRGREGGAPTVLIATHDLHRLSHLATRVVVLEEGVVGADSGVGSDRSEVERVLARYREVNR